MTTVELVVFRVVSIVVLLAAGLIHVSWTSFLTNREAQLVATTIVVAVILFGDAIAGLALGMALLLLYFRVYRDMLSPPSFAGGKLLDRSLVGTDYITPEDLQRAQDNVVNESDFATEMKGIRGVYGEPVYGAQGMDRDMPGYDISPFAMPKAALA